MAESFQIWWKTISSSRKFKKLQVGQIQEDSHIDTY